MQLIIFTDLDGTLLDYSTNSWKKAEEALSMIKNKNIPLVLCSSKTKTEIESIRKEIKNKDPFISENGGGIFIPKEYFSFKIDYDYIDGDYLVIKLGKDYKYLRKKLEEIKKETGFQILGMGDMGLKIVMKYCGFDESRAKKAKKREFVEPYIIQKGDVKKIKEITEKKGLSYTAGLRFHYIMGNNDKGKAVEILTKLFRKEFGDVSTVAIGDSLNDLEMLRFVDNAFVVKRPDGKFDNRIGKNKKITRIDGIGPEGWNKAIIGFLGGM